MSGLCELGLDPRLLVTVRAPDTDAALRTAADALACDALGAVVLEVWGQARQLDLVASRKLTLAAQASGVTALAAADGGGAAALDRGDQMDRARGAFAAGSAHLDAPGARRCSTRNWFVTVMARSAAGSWNGNVMSAFSANRRRILSLWLPRLPIDRIKRKLSQARANKALSSEAGTGSRGHASKHPTHRAIDPSIRRRRQAEQRAADLCARRCWPRALGLSIGLPLANARAICPELTVFDADEAADRKTLERHRRLVRPLHAAGGARSAAWAVSRHHRLRPSVRRRARAAADRMRRADAARLCRQRRDRRHLDLRPHADAPCFMADHRRWRGGRSRRSAAGIRARRR